MTDFVCQLRQSLQSSVLQQAYDFASNAKAVLLEEERSRQLRVKVLLLEEANETLSERLGQANELKKTVEQDNLATKRLLQNAQSNLQQATSDLKLRSRDIEYLKVGILPGQRRAYALTCTQTELSALNGVSTDSAKLLTEKLAISRELSRLKPQVEHLQSQLITFHSVLSEKLALERQLSTTQVELETERRALQRSRDGHGQVRSEEALLRQQIADVRHELEQERTNAVRAQREASNQYAELRSHSDALEERLRSALGKVEVDATTTGQMDTLREKLKQEEEEKKKMHRDSLRKAAEWESQRTILESKLDAFRTKLRSTKEQLKDTQGELQTARNTAISRPQKNTSFDVLPRGVGNTNVRKRGASVLDEDATIGTPGNVPPPKRGKRMSTLVGDKSAFSITPFLNRTASIAPEEAMRNDSPSDQSVMGTDKDVRPSIEDNGTELSPSAGVQTAKSRPAPSKAPSRKVLPAARPGQGRKRERPQALEQVAEEEQCDVESSGENGRTALASPEPTTGIARKPSALKFETIDPKKRKRRLIGNSFGGTLFDEDENDAPKPRGVTSLRAGKSMKSLGQVKLAQPSGGTLKANNVFGGFSPLKKDRGKI